MKPHQHIFYLIGFVLLLCWGCKSTKNISEIPYMPTVTLDTLLVEDKKLTYNPSERRVNDLLHTKIEISFDWQNQWALGKATLLFKSFFYETNVLELDAKGFQINELSLINEGNKKPLNYEYDNKIITIELNKTYTKEETYEIFIDYIAKPNELKAGGSKAITDDRGLYFINPLEEEKNKPRQLWTQGETEASSCWFPTIDAPNERTSQEMFITVEEGFKTISNGKLIKQTNNDNGTRTDYWKQDIAHAPYLFMMAVGNFAEVKDNWNNIPMNYYVDEAYAPYAKQVFGNTGEILTFFSEKFGMDYPWDKYHQVVVHDFVSGAMENTGAVIHYDALHQTDRELLDYNLEDIIAHEAAHHWFGDYVTCESWANIPLNESFATWAEIIWKEHKYGKDEAELKILQDRLSYFDEAESYQEALIRFYYGDKEDMFDRHSYQKGGQVLLMLAQYLGEEAFYKGLDKYLKDNALQPVEIHDLRLALEHVCGEDLNWFFNQWFLGKGHPKLKVESYYDAEFKNVVLSIEQQQKGQIFQLPVKVNLHFGKQIETQNIFINEKQSSFTFEVAKKPDLIDFDPNNYLLAEVEEKKPIEDYVFQYQYTNGYLNHLEAIEGLTEHYYDALITKDILMAALDNPFWGIREKAMDNIDIEDEGFDLKILKKKFLQIAKNDDKTSTRSAAIGKVSNKKFNVRAASIEPFLKDSSYLVMSSSLYALNRMDSTLALKKAADLTNESNQGIQHAVASILMRSTEAAHHPFFENYWQSATSYNRYTAVRNYGNYLNNISDLDTSLKIVGNLETSAQTEKQKWLRYYAAEALYNKYNKLQENLTNAKQTNNKLSEEIQNALNKIMAAETDQTVIEYYKQFKLNSQ